MNHRENVFRAFALVMLAFCLCGGCTPKQKDYRQMEIKDIYDSELDKAVAFYEKYALTHPKDLKAHNNLGILYRRSGNLNGARTQYEYVLLMDSTDAEAHNNLGTWFGIVNQVDSAIAEFQLAVKYKPDFAKPHRNLAAIYQRSGQDSLALVEIETYMKLEPNVPDTAQLRKTIEDITKNMGKK